MLCVPPPHTHPLRERKQLSCMWTHEQEEELAQLFERFKGDEGTSWYNVWWGMRSVLMELYFLVHCMCHGGGNLQGYQRLQIGRTVRNTKLTPNVVNVCDHYAKNPFTGSP